MKKTQQTHALFFFTKTRVGRSTMKLKMVWIKSWKTSGEINWNEKTEHGFAVFFSQKTNNTWLYCLVFLWKKHNELNKMFCLVSVKKTQQIKQDHKIYTIIITTDLNTEDESIRQIIERHLRKKSYLQ
jgi:hypothetical protein